MSAHGWIQWKGTNVCMDVHCECGHLSHVDADFCYYVKCPNCGKVWECDGNIALNPVPEEKLKTIEERVIIAAEE